MKLIGKPKLSKFKKKHADARSQIESWEAEVEGATWKTPVDLKNRYPNASLLSKKRVIFDICWNKYRILVMVNYKNSIVLVLKIDLHKKYDKWNLD